MTRYRTTIAGARVIQHPSGNLYDHVATALASAKNGERTWVKASDGPGSAHYSLEFRRLDGKTHVTPKVGDRPLSLDAADAPAWMREAVQIISRLQGTSP